jgi:hypothetical protein
VGSLFAAFLGFNPLKNLLGPSGELDRLPKANADRLTGHEFFPRLISGPFHHGLVVVFSAAALMSLVAAVASLARGGRYVHDERVDLPATPRPAAAQRSDGTGATAGRMG